MSNDILGQQLKTGLAWESTPLTAETTLTDTIPIESSSIFYTPEYSENERNIGDVNARTVKLLRKAHAEGSISLGALDIDLSFHALKSAFRGGVTKDGTGPYTYTFEKANYGSRSVEIPTFTWFEEVRTGDTYAFYGCGFNSLSLNWSEGNDPTIEGDIIGIGRNSVTTQTYSYSDTALKTVTGKGVSLKYATTVAGLTSSPSIPKSVSEVNLTISNNIEARKTANGELNASYLSWGGFTPELSITADIDEVDFYSIQEGLTKYAWEITYQLDADNKLVLTMSPQVAEVEDSGISMNEAKTGTLNYNFISALNSDAFDIKAVLHSTKDITV